ncbi:MAG: indole-3-glycerol phosphate synthase [Chlorobiota bacterium]|nr:MAG: indole-3-glycerol phosphate synthase TrpC [Chlorobiota bacterium]
MNFLDKILEVKRREVAELHLKQKIREYPPDHLFNAPGFDLNEEINKASGIAIIAEVKKASPSKGVLREDFDHVAMATDYMNNGASALSILTDREFFQGDINYLADIAAIKTRPLLRKDFIIDELQIVEAKEAGADAILLISEALTKEEIAKLTRYAHSLSLGVLLELHSPGQLGKIDFGLNTLIGVNNRDLITFSTDLATTEKISGLVPAGVTLVSESGIRTKDDVRRVMNAGAKAVLVGEHFMRQSSPGEALAEMKRWAQ